MAARVVLPASHPPARGKTIFLGELAHERLIEFDVEPALSNTRKIFHDFAVHPRLGMKTDSIELIRARRHADWATPCCCITGPAI